MTRFAATLLLPLAAVAAGEPLAGATSATELVLACRAFREEPQGKDGIRCHSYLRGYIEAAAATGEIVLGSHDSDHAWADRAARTRIGARLQRGSLLRDPEFCLPTSAPIEELADRVARLPVERSPADERLAAEMLRAVLRRHYSCARPRPSPPVAANPEPTMVPTCHPSERAGRAADRALAPRAA